MILLEVFTGASTLRVSSAPYAHPTAPGLYEERLLDTSWLELPLFHAAPARPLGRGRGCMVLGNLDGHLDWLAMAGIEGRAVRLLVGMPAADYASFAAVFTGLVAQAVVGRDEVALVLCDRLEAPDKATVRYPGIA